MIRFPRMWFLLGCLAWLLQSAAGFTSAGQAEEPAPATVPLPTKEGASPPEVSLPLTWQEAYKESADKPKTYSKGPNVHRSSLYCSECHGQGTPSPKNLLYEGDDIALCRSCHPRSLYNLHIVGIRPKDVQVPDEFPLSQGRITCVTCHDEPSCNPGEHPSWQRPFFLRGNQSGFLFCFSCHSAKGYESYNPHDVKHLQSASERKNNCLFCHTAELPVEARRGLTFAALKGDPNDLCSACHLEEPHFGIPAHFEVRREASLPSLEHAARMGGPRLPLGQGNRPLCVSCHDPHIPGLIPQEEEGPDVWMQIKGDSDLRRQYLEEGLYPYVRDRVAELESKFGRTLIIREPGLFHGDRNGLLRQGIRLKGSMCLLCHDVFEEDRTHGESRRPDYRMLH